MISLGNVRRAVSVAIPLAIGSWLLVSGPGSASELATTENEATYMRYHTAIRVAERCNRVEFTDEQHSAMAAYISDQINHDIGTKRLRLIGEAKRNADEITSGGCANAEAQEMMSIFETELEPTLP